MLRVAHWWQWPTILSIDAPLVATAWQVAMARAAGAPLAWPETVVLGLSVWLAYMADRWNEGWRLDTRDIRTPRHHFYQRFRWPVAGVWIAGLAVDLWLAVTRLTPADLAAGIALTAAVAVYLLSHQLVHRHRPWRLPKELCIAGLLTAGVAIFLRGAPHPGDLAMPVVLFALLCFTNCALISVWERDVDRAHGQTSLALADQGNASLIRQLPWITLVVALAALPFAPADTRALPALAAASALLLAAVDAAERAIGWPRARVLADVALMTPFAWLWLR